MPCCRGKGGTFKGHPSCLVKVCSIPCRRCPRFTPQSKPHHLVLLNVLHFSKTQTDVICVSLASSSAKIQWKTGEKCQENIQVLRRTWHAQPSVFLGGPNPCDQARHSTCRQVPLALLAQTYQLPVLFGCHQPRGPLLPCLCVPWPLPTFVQGGAHQS